MQNSPVYRTLTLMMKAGKIMPGLELTVEAMKKGRIFLVLTASDVAPKTKKEIIFKADGDVPILDVGMTKFEIGKAISKPLGIMGIMDKGLAEKITSEIDMQNREGHNI